MADRGIIFSAIMIAALLAGRKTMTRRLLKRPGALAVADAWGAKAMSLPENADLLPYAVGDRLWVREGWTTRQGLDGTAPRDISPRQSVGYLANTEEGPWLGKPRPSIRMPRWASRLTLTVTGVKVERLNDLTEADALAEGVAWDADKQWFHVPGVAHPNKDFPVLSRVTAREMFAALWDVIHGSGAWLASPWVVAVSFTVAQRNIDAEEAVAA